jgi:hypothetical protein
LHEARFVLLDCDKRLIVASSFDRPWDVYPLYILLVGGLDGPRISDGVDQPDQPPSRSFPYLIPPNPNPPDPMTIFVAPSAPPEEAASSASDSTLRGHVIAEVAALDAARPRGARPGASTACCWSRPT